VLRYPYFVFLYIPVLGIGIYTGIEFMIVKAVFIFSNNESNESGNTNRILVAALRISVKANTIIPRVPTKAAFVWQ
jgi:hypothetical protein